MAFDGWRKGIGPKQQREAKAMKAAVMATATATATATPAGGNRSEAFAAATPSAKPAHPSAWDAKEAAVAALEKAEEEEEEGDEEEEKGGGHSDGANGDVFGLQAGGGGSRLLQRGQHQKVPFVEARVRVDLAVARRTVISGWRGALTRAIRLRQAKQEWRVKREGRRQPT